jgi:hypothetical protein
MWLELDQKTREAPWLTSEFALTGLETPCQVLQRRQADYKNPEPSDLLQPLSRLILVAFLAVGLSPTKFVQRDLTSACRWSIGESVSQLYDVDYYSPGRMVQHDS